MGLGDLGCQVNELQFGFELYEFLYINMVNHESPNQLWNWISCNDLSLSLGCCVNNDNLFNVIRVWGYQ